VLFKAESPGYLGPASTVGEDRGQAGGVFFERVDGAEIG
jgi:hypothetical protein